MSTLYFHQYPFSESWTVCKRSSTAAISSNGIKEVFKAQSEEKAAEHGLDEWTARWVETGWIAGFEG